jgi:hypothetical protein
MMAGRRDVRFRRKAVLHHHVPTFNVAKVDQTYLPAQETRKLCEVRGYLPGLIPGQ